MIVISLAPEHESRVELCHDTGWEAVGVRVFYLTPILCGIMSPSRERELIESLLPWWEGARGSGMDRNRQNKVDRPLGMRSDVTVTRR
jgi:hypothetical protein